MEEINNPTREEQETDFTLPEGATIINKNEGSEQVHFKTPQGFEISLTSASTPIPELVGYALHLFDKLKENSTKTNGSGGYFG